MLGYFFLGKYVSDGKWRLPGVCCTHNLEWMHLWLKERQTSIHFLPDGQIGLFPDSFGLKLPDADQTSFSFPEGPIAFWVYATHLRPFPLNDYISILSSPNHPFEIVLVIHSEQFTILIALAFFTVHLRWKLIICSFNSKSHLHVKLGQWPLHSSKVCLPVL